MKILRPILFVACAVALVAAAALLAVMAPPFQTWVVRMELADVAGVRASLDSISAGFGRVEAEGLKAEKRGGVLVLPSVRARIPLVRALWNHDIHVETLVAKGWTLDLSGMPGGSDEAPETRAAEAAPILVENALGALLGGSRLPFDLSVDSIDLEGDVVLPPSSGRPAVKAHVSIDGGGFTVGRTGELTIETVAASGADTATIQAKISAAMDTTRTINAVSAQATVGSFVSGREEDIKASASVLRRPGSMTYSFEVGPAGRTALAVSATATGPAMPFRGVWKADLRSEDLSAILIGRVLPDLSAVGSGSLDADPDLKRIRVSGSLTGSYGRLGRAFSWLSRGGTGDWDASLDCEVRSGVLALSGLSAHLRAPGPLVSVRMLQPVTLNLENGDIAAANPAADLADINVASLPLAWLPMLPCGFEFAGNGAGEFGLAARAGSLLVEMKGPLRGSGLSIRQGADTVARGLSFEAVASGSLGAGTGELSLSPVTVDSPSGRIAEAAITLSPAPTKESGLAYSGHVAVHPDAIARLAGLGWTAPSATFDGKGRLGSSFEMSGALRVSGPDGESVSGTVNADTEAGSGEVLAPLSVSANGSTSLVTVEGSWSGSGSNARQEVKLSSDDARLSDVVSLLSPFTERGAPGKADSRPFWGEWRGRLGFAFGKLRTGGGEYTDVGGTLEFGESSADFMGGHAEVGLMTMATLDAQLDFDAARRTGRYVLAGHASLLNPLDASLLIPRRSGEDPVLEGKFAFLGTVEGRADSLGGLASTATASLHLTSANGIIRLLKVDVSDAVPEEPERVSDSAEAVGNFVGSVLLGIKGHSLDPAKNKVGKVSQAVIDFTNLVGEVGYDKAEASVTLHTDGSIDLSQLELMAPDLHLTGTGRIASLPGKPLSEEPLSLFLKVGVKDVAAAKIEATGLLSKSKDAQGYSLLAGAARFGGTIAAVDSSAWHDLLAAPVKAAPRK